MDESRTQQAPCVATFPGASLSREGVCGEEVGRWSAPKGSTVEVGYERDSWGGASAAHSHTYKCALLFLHAVLCIVHMQAQLDTVSSFSALF